MAGNMDQAARPAPAADPVVFISHSTKDGDTGERLAALLKCAFDLKDEQIVYSSNLQHSLPLARDVADEVRRAINGCKAFIGLISPNTYESTWEMLELGAGWLHHDKFMLLSVREGYLSRLKPPLSEIRSVGLDESVAIHQIIEKVQEFTGIAPANAKTYAREQDELVRFVRQAYPDQWPSEPLVAPPQPASLLAPPQRRGIAARWTPWVLATLVVLLGAGHIWKGAYVSAQMMEKEAGVEGSVMITAQGNYLGNPNGFVRFPIGLPGRPLVISASKKVGSAYVPTTVNGAMNFEYHPSLWAYLFEPPLLILKIDSPPQQPPPAGG